MIIKWQNKKTKSQGHNSGQAAVDYLLGKNLDRKHASVIKGDPNGFIKMTESLPNQKKKYSYGVITFDEKEISEERLDTVISNFENLLFAGLEHPPEILWTKHTDKNNIELNFHIPNFADGKAWTPYLNKLDGKSFDDFQTLTNELGGYSDPHDPMNRDYSPRIKYSDISKKIKDGKPLETKEVFLETIDRLAFQELKKGGTVNREWVKETINNFSNETGIKIEITKETKNNLSISINGQKPFRAGDGYFKRGVEYSKGDEKLRQERSDQYLQNRKKRIPKLKQSVKSGIDGRKKKHRRVYKKYQQALQENNSNPLVISNDDFSNNQLNSIRNKLLAGYSTSERIRKAIEQLEQDENLRRNKELKTGENEQPRRISSTRINRENEQNGKQAQSARKEKEQTIQARREQSNLIAKVVINDTTRITRRISKISEEQTKQFRNISQQQQRQTNRIDEFLRRYDGRAGGPTNDLRNLIKETITAVKEKRDELMRRFKNRFGLGM